MANTYFVAKAVLADSDGKFLLLTRSDTHPSLAGLFDLPGGMINQGEEPGEGVKREIFEETGLKVESLNVMYATTMLIGGSSYPTLLYHARISSRAPSIEISWEHSDYEWADFSKLADVEPQLAPTYREALDYVRSNDILKDL